VHVLFSTEEEEDQVMEKKKKSQKNRRSATPVSQQTHVPVVFMNSFIHTFILFNNMTGDCCCV
jgi:hypothetical protein